MPECGEGSVRTEKIMCLEHAYSYYYYVVDNSYCNHLIKPTPNTLQCIVGTHIPECGTCGDGYVDVPKEVCILCLYTCVFFLKFFVGSCFVRMAVVSIPWK